MMKIIKYAGQPFCILLYIMAIYCAVVKTPIPLIALFVMHLSEYFIIGKKTGKEKELPQWKALVNCLLFGFTWWLPLRKSTEGSELQK